jgi:beta-N-acetylhexosaminidase
MFKIHFLLFCLFISSTVQSQSGPAFLQDYNKTWVDSVFNTLTLDQKIGQLLMPRGNYSGKPHDEAKLEQWVRDYKIGGIVFFATNPSRQALLTNRLQSISKVPLLIGQDLEWGLVMRLDSTDRFPYAMSIGAINGQNEVIYDMGREIARQCKRIGVHVNYAPVVDVNINPLNPVINFRSFGADKNKVATKAKWLMQGMQSERLLCTAKHFPGHGDTNVDSHKDLPVIAHDRKRLDDIELYPFKALINEGLSGVMTAHLNIPALEQQANLASTFSKSIITDLLQKELDFKGLVFTDAMEMEGAVKNFPKGEAFVRALMAGNDIIETFIDLPTAVEEIKKAILAGRISQSIIDAKVRKVLKAKSWVGLDRYKPIEMQGLIEDLNTAKADVINHKLAKKIVTCLKNQKGLLPLKDLTKRYAMICMEGDADSEFVRISQNYAAIDVYQIPPLANQIVVDSIIAAVKTYDQVIVAIQLNDIRPARKYGLTAENTAHIKRLITLPNAIVAVMASAFVMQNIEEFGKCHTLLMGYQKTKYAEAAMVQAIFGAEDIDGTLPMTINDDFVVGMSIPLKSVGRLRFGPPEIVGIDRDSLFGKIDQMINAGLEQRAFPGCVVQISKDGYVIEQKAYGYHQYKNDPQNLSNYQNWQKIDDAMDNFEQATTRLSIDPKDKDLDKTTIASVYDLASVTKIAASTLAIMKLVSEGKIDVDKTFGDYVPTAKSSNKSQLKLRDMLTHRSGLQPWIPFWKYAIDTVATMDKAMLAGLVSQDSIIGVIKRPSFFRRIFGSKSTKKIDHVATVEAHPVLWNKVLNRSTLTWKAGTFSSKSSLDFPLEIAPRLYAHRDFPSRVKKMILASPLGDTSAHKYVYSDLHYYFYPEIIERITGQKFEDYLGQIYDELGTHSLSFNPQNGRDQIVPTEVDTLFRQSLIYGKVHDEGAALMGGVSGHAGLFGNANDLHTLMYMYLNKGNYAGQQWISPEVMERFTSYQYTTEGNRRGIGFDKKDLDAKVGNAPSLASSGSFGHSGFTGTYTWIDPKYNIVYVFLSNRVYPTRENGLINTLKIRQRIGDAIIESIGTYEPISK